MHPSPKTLLVVAILLVASVSIAQEVAPSADSAFMARFSYDNFGFAQPGSMMHVCFAVYKDGDYRIVRSFDDGHTQRLRGNMPKEEFRQLSDLLEAAEFQNLSGNGRPGVVLKEAETFAVEIGVGRWHEDGPGTKWLEPERRGLRRCNADGGPQFPS